MKKQKKKLSKKILQCAISIIKEYPGGEELTMYLKDQPTLTPGERILYFLEAEYRVYGYNMCGYTPIGD